MHPPPSDLNAPLSAIEISNATGFPDSTVRHWSRQEGFPKPIKTINGRKYYAFTDFLHWVSSRRSEATKELREEKARVEVELLKARLELEQGRAEAQAIANQRVMKDLIVMDEARNLFLKTIAEFMSQLDNMHGRLAPSLATMDDANDCADAIKQEIRRIRNHVSDIIAES